MVGGALVSPNRLPGIMLRLKFKSDTEPRGRWPKGPGWFLRDKAETFETGYTDLDTQTQHTPAICRVSSVLG